MVQVTDAVWTALLWLWHRLAVVALIRLLAREIPYAVGAALTRQKKEEEEIKSRAFTKYSPVYPQFVWLGLFLIFKEKYVLALSIRHAAQFPRVNYAG